MEVYDAFFLGLRFGFVGLAVWLVLYATYSVGYNRGWERGLASWRDSLNERSK